MKQYQDPNFLSSDQYKNQDNLQARSQLHVLYSTAKKPWFAWVFEQLHLEENMEVLECGCGTGLLWQSNHASLPQGCHITLTDVSPGMVLQAKENLVVAGAPLSLFDFYQADIQELHACAKNNFDRVVANKMLYHVADIPKALVEVVRVLKPGGVFYCATNGGKNMVELTELIGQALPHFKQKLPFVHDKVSSNFSLDQGSLVLQKFFKKVVVKRYADSLAVKAVEPLMAYYLSSSEARSVLNKKDRNTLRDFLQSKLESEGSISISKDTGMFIASN